MGNSIITNDQLVTFIGVATQQADGTITANRLDTDRGTELSSGALVGKTTINVGMIPAAGSKGYFEYVVFKAQRQAVTPVKGTFPIPADADVITSGLQQLYRLSMPGWVIQYGQWSVSAEFPMTRKITIDWSKFKMDKTRDGDFYGITYFNRTGGTVTFDWQARYHSRQ